MSCADALAHLPARELESAERDALLHGRPIELRAEAGPVRCLLAGHLVCVAEASDGALRSRVLVDEA
jgi:hypothetical protein